MADAVGKYYPRSIVCLPLDPGQRLRHGKPTLYFQSDRDALTCRCEPSGSNLKLDRRYYSIRVCHLMGDCFALRLVMTSFHPLRHQNIRLADSIGIRHHSCNDIPHLLIEPKGMTL